MQHQKRKQHRRNSNENTINPHPRITATGLSARSGKTIRIPTIPLKTTNTHTRPTRPTPRSRTICHSTRQTSGPLRILRPGSRRIRLSLSRERK